MLRYTGLPDSVNTIKPTLLIVPPVVWSVCVHASGKIDQHVEPEPTGCSTQKKLPLLMDGLFLNESTHTVRSSHHFGYKRNLLLQS